MENKKLYIKYWITPYGVVEYSTVIVLAVTFFLFGVLLLPNSEGIVLLVGSIILVVYSLVLLHLKYMSTIVLTEKNVSTKKRSLSWEEVCITMSYYFFHKGVRGETYFIFFDDHYLSEEEIRSHKVKSSAFYLMITPKKLDVILKLYNKKIQLLDSDSTDKKGLYAKVFEYNRSLDNKD